MSIAGFPTSSDIYLEVDGTRVAVVQSYTARATKSSTAVEAFGESEPVATVPGQATHVVELTRLYATDEAVREMQNKLLGVETTVTNWQRRQNQNNNYTAVVPYDLEQQRKETREMLDDLTTRDQRLMFAVVTLVHLADSKEELDSDTETLQSIARKHLCQMGVLNWQQREGLDTALPLGLRKIDALRTLTTEALAVLMPFRAQEIHDPQGVYYGQNAISKNLILADRMSLLNGNGFILGVSGSGKSFTAKREIANIALSTNDDIIVIDPEREYHSLVNGLGGEVIHISATSPNHINAMDMK